jgi:hypothetical protein
VKIKALSFRQPWATLILEGRKTLDLRTWYTKYRGPLAIYASLEVEKEACLANEFDPQTLSTGVVIGIVDLVDILPLDETAYSMRLSEHLAGRPYRQGLYGWVLKNPRVLEPPVVVKGRLNLFEIVLDDHQSSVTNLTFSETNNQIPTNSVRKTESIPRQAINSQLSSGNSEFELRVVLETGEGYRLEFTQKIIEAVPDQSYIYQQPNIKARVSVELGGNNLRAVADVVLETLRQNGYKPTDLKATRREPFHLDEQTGVRLGLIFLAVKPISKASRIEQISHGVQTMTGEELFYWYSKCTSNLLAERAQKALRVLLSEE